MLNSRQLSGGEQLFGGSRLSAHEDLSRHIDVQPSSDREFGLVIAAVFTAIGLWPLIRHGHPRLWCFALAAALGLCALVIPRALHPLNRVWTALAVLLNRVMNPIATGVMFFLAFLPVALIMRAMKKDPLRLKLDPEARSYWIKRDPPGPLAGSMIDQF